MKKILFSVIGILTSVMMIFTFASCGGNSADNKAAKEIDINEAYKSITEKFSMPEETIELQGEDLLDYYGIESSKVAEYKAIQDACGYKDEIVIIKATDENAASEIEKLLTEHIDYQKDSMQNYDPAQYDILQKSEVITDGVYVAMFISAEQEAMADTFNSFVK